MTIRRITPFLPSGADYERSKQQFVDLGFAVLWEAGGLCELQLGDDSFLLQDLHLQEMQDNLMVQVRVDDLDDWWTHLQATGVLDRYGLRCSGPKDFPWAREIHLIDLAGICWHFRQA